MIGFFLTFFFIRSEPIYLWEENKMPAKRTYSEGSGYFDPPDFRPIIEHYQAQGKIKGAILICPGGAFQFRGMQHEGYNVASRLSQLGYQCFVVSYRLRPYTQEEGALDLQRAVRYVRKNSELYGINPKDIAVVGFSAGGILCGELCLNWKDLTNAKKLDSNYVPDDLDHVNSTVSAIGHIYSFYGRLSVSNNNVETLRKAKIPPSFFAFGTRDLFYSQFIQNAQASRDAGAIVEEHVFQGQPHGFGPGNANSNWIPLFDIFLQKAFSSEFPSETQVVTSSSSKTLTKSLEPSYSNSIPDNQNIDDNSHESQNKKKKFHTILIASIASCAAVVIIIVSVFIVIKVKRSRNENNFNKNNMEELENDLISNENQF